VPSAGRRNLREQVLPASAAGMSKLKMEDLVPAARPLRLLPRALSWCFSSTWTMRWGNSKLVPIKLAGQVDIGAGGDSIGGVGVEVDSVMVEQDVDVKVSGVIVEDVHLVVVVVLVIVV